MSQLWVPVVIVVVIGLIAGLGLAIASILLAVPKDEKAEAIEEMLPSRGQLRCLRVFRMFRLCKGFGPRRSKARPLCPRWGKGGQDHLPISWFGGCGC